MTMPNFKITFENPWSSEDDPNQTIVVQAKDEISAIRKLKKIAPKMVVLEARWINKISTFRVFYRYWNGDKPGILQSQLVDASTPYVAMKRLALRYEGSDVVKCCDIFSSEVFQSASD